jgi:predicted component of type VI protein secretion system
VSKLTLSFKGNVLKAYPVKEGDMTIGRDPSCDIHIDSLAVSPVHARISLQQGKYVITDMDSADGIFVNHQKVNEQELQPDDIIRIGKHTLKLEQGDIVESFSSSTPAATATATSTHVPLGWLQFLSGNNMGKTIKLKASLTDLGKLGLQPALIAKRSNGYYITNLDDSRMLTVDGSDIGSESCQLTDGNIINMGDNTLQFYLQDE